MKKERCANPKKFLDLLDKKFKKGTIRKWYWNNYNKGYREKNRRWEEWKRRTRKCFNKGKVYAKVYDFPILAMDGTLYIKDIPYDKQVRKANGFMTRIK